MECPPRGHIFICRKSLPREGEGGAYAPDEGEVYGRYPLISHLR